MATGDYYIRLFEGPVDFLSGVTSTPILVPESIMDAYYRDEGNSNEAIAFSEPSPTEAIVDTDAATGTIVPADISTISTILNDLDLHVPPRQLEYELSYWQFQVGALSYFYRQDVVQGFSNNPSPNF